MGAGSGLIPLVIIFMIGVFLILLALATGRHAKTVRRTFFAVIIIGLAVIGLGIGLYFLP
jgi:uncharacterized membrane protein YczE